MEKICKWVLTIMLAGLIGSIILLLCVPPVSRDALTHHLFIPKLYLQKGAIHEIPSVVFSYYPMNLDLLYTAALYLTNDIFPKFVHFAFGLLTALLVFLYLKRRLNRLYGMFGALFFLSIPVVVKLSITVYVDLGLVFFSTLCLLSVIKWAESGYRRRHLFVAGIACGLALGTKYNGLILLFIVSALLPFLYLGQRNRSALKQLKAVQHSLFFIVVSLVVFSPWMIRNTLWTGNPIYPLFNQVFTAAGDRNQLEGLDAAEERTETPDLGRLDDLEIGHESGKTFGIRRQLFGEKWWQTLLIPLRIFFQGKDNDGKYFDGKLTPFLLLLSFFAFLHSEETPRAIKTEKRFLAFFALLFILITLFTTDMRIRYVAPTIPALVILCIYGLSSLGLFIRKKIATAEGKKAGLVLIHFVAAVMLLMNASYVRAQFRYVNPLIFLSGKIGRDAYIEHFRGEYPVIQFANTHIAEDAKIYAIFLGNRGYYFEKEIVFSNPQRLKRMAGLAASAVELRDMLAASGITHLFIRHDIFVQWLTSAYIDADERKKILALTNETAVLQFSKNGYGLYELQ